MSTFQIEFPDETRQRLEELAQEEGCEPQSWVMALVEEALRKRQEDKRYIEAKLLEALNSGEGHVVDDAWWQRLEEEVLAELDKQNKP